MNSFGSPSRTCGLADPDASGHVSQPRTPGGKEGSVQNHMIVIKKSGIMRTVKNEKYFNFTIPNTTNGKNHPVVNNCLRIIHFQIL